MKMLTLGDSFTYGDELFDLNSNWPTVLANKLGASLTNLAKPGAGNMQMIRKCVEHAQNYDLIIIAWSHFARIEFADDHGIYDVWPGCKGVMFTGNLNHRTELIKYISQYHDDNYFYRQYLLNIILVQKYLKTIDKKFIMLDSFGNHTWIEQRSTDLVSQIETQYFLGWPNESMMEWAWGCPKGPGGHFLEQGHQKIADKIYEHIRYLGWLS